jgi:DNA-directed RNA polymerase subunit RPC12/RpoP
MDGFKLSAPHPLRVGRTNLFQDLTRSALGFLKMRIDEGRIGMKCCSIDMSEFKYACPVCGQHMVCDSSQGGTVMECPTCFQKIIAPQAPAPGSKFILTGQKYSEKKSSAGVPKVLLLGGTTDRSLPWVVLIVLVVLLAAGAAVFVMRGRVERARQAEVQPLPPKPPNPEKSKPKPAESVQSVPPPATDELWQLSLGTEAIPDGPVVGRIHGLDFGCDRVVFQGGVLILRAGRNGSVESGVIINFSGANQEALSGKTINVTTNADLAARVTLRWQADGEGKKEDFTNGYALRLEFGQLLNERLPGKIHLCLPDDEKSYLVGSFIADVRKPKPVTPKPKQK